MTIDLQDFDVSAACEAGSELTLTHPTTGEPLDIVINVVGADSRRAREAGRAIEDEIRREAMEKRLKADDTTFERMAAKRAAALTIGWSGLQWGGEEFRFSEANAIRLYTERRWIREQVEAFAGQRANFFKNSETTSAG